jgi:hypothetical protein
MNMKTKYEQDSLPTKTALLGFAIILLICILADNF